MFTNKPAHVIFSLLKGPLFYTAGMSLTKLSLAGNNLIIPGQGEFGK
jgi:hypothetical protein